MKKVSNNFIDDNEEEDADSDDSSDSVSGKRKMDSDESEISDDDLALIEENTGVKIKVCGYRIFIKIFMRPANDFEQNSPTLSNWPDMTTYEFVIFHVLRELTLCF